MSSGGAKTTAVAETVAAEMFKGGGRIPDSLADVSNGVDTVVVPVGRRAVAGAGAEGFGFCPALLGAKASAADHPASLQRVCEGCGKRGANGRMGSIFCV